MMVESVTGCSAPRLQHCSTSRYLVIRRGSTGVRARCPRTCASPEATQASDLVAMQVDHTHPTAGPDQPAARRKRTMRYRSRVTAPAALLGSAAALSLASPAQADASPAQTDAAQADADRGTGTPGPETLGDSVYPGLGNGGYRVSAYDLDLAYDAGTRLVEASATLTVTATQ